MTSSKTTRDPSALDPWQTLEASWRDPGADVVGPEPPDPATFGQRTARIGRRQRRIAIMVWAGEALVALVFGSLALFWLWQGSSSDRMAGAFVLTLLAAVGPLRRRTWQRSGPALEAPPDRYLEDLLERNSQGLRSLRLGLRVLGAQILFFLLWLPVRLDPFTLPGLLRVYAYLAAWSLGFLITLFLARRFLTRERHHLEALRRDLQGEERA